MSSSILCVIVIIVCVGANLWGEREESRVDSCFLDFLSSLCNCVGIVGSKTTGQMIFPNFSNRSISELSSGPTSREPTHLDLGSGEENVGRTEGQVWLNRKLG